MINESAPADPSSDNSVTFGMGRKAENWKWGKESKTKYPSSIDLNGNSVTSLIKLSSRRGAAERENPLAESLNKFK